LVQESVAEAYAVAPKPDIRRKNMRLDQRKLTAVKEFLGCATETETVEQALDLVLFRHEVSEGLRRIAGTGIIRDVFGDGS
jgi:hypothetical protein